MTAIRPLHIAIALLLVLLAAVVAVTITPVGSSALSGFVSPSSSSHLDAGGRYP